MDVIVRMAHSTRPVRVRFVRGANRDEAERAVIDAALGRDGVGKLLHQSGLAAQHRHLEAGVVVEMHMHRGDLQVVMGMMGLGFAAFATVAPLQLWVMFTAKGAGESLASSFNIAAFNLGNAIGAWAGGVALDHLGLDAVPWTAALFPALALVVALAANRITMSKEALA